MYVTKIYSEVESTSVKSRAVSVEDTSGILQINTFANTQRPDETTVNVPINGTWDPANDWAVGTGDPDDGTWEYYGDENENERLYGVDPFGGSSVLWRSTDNTDSIYDGGFYGGFGQIDPTAKHRVCCFFKVTDPDNATSVRAYFGPSPTVAGISAAQGRVLNGNTGAVDSNPYFFSNEIVEDADKGQWLLAVGHIQAAGTSTPVTNDTDSGVYYMDGTDVTGYTMQDHVFQATNTSAGCRMFQYNNPADSGDIIDFYGVRIDKIDGSEPSISDILKTGTPDDDIDVNVYGILKHKNNMIARDYSQSVNLLMRTESQDTTSSDWAKTGVWEQTQVLGDTTQTWKNATGSYVEWDVTAVTSNGLLVGTDKNDEPHATAGETLMHSMYIKQPASNALSGISFGFQDNTTTNDFYRIEIDFGADGVPIVVTKDPEVAGANGHYGYEDAGNGWYRFWVGIDVELGNTLDGDKIRPYITNSTAANSHGDQGTGKSIYFAGMQLESAAGLTEPTDFNAVWVRDKYNLDLLTEIKDATFTGDTLTEVIQSYPEYTVKMTNNTAFRNVVVFLGHNALGGA